MKFEVKIWGSDDQVGTQTLQATKTITLEEYDGTAKDFFEEMTKKSAKYFKEKFSAIFGSDWNTKQTKLDDHT